MKALTFCLICIVAVSASPMISQAIAQSNQGKGRRVVLVTNIVPSGAQPIHGDIVKVEVLDAIDLKQSSWLLKVAVRIRSARNTRVRCALKIEFDGNQMGQPWNVDLPAGQSDLVVFSCYCGEGKAAGQLSKLTAKASDIRLGD